MYVIASVDVVEVLYSSFIIVFPLSNLLVNRLSRV